MDERKQEVNQISAEEPFYLPIRYLLFDYRFNLSWFAWTIRRIQA